MENIPPEVVGLICSFLTHKDCGSLRHVCKYFAQVGIPFMFKHVVANTTSPRLNALENISNNPHIAGEVRKLTHFGFRLRSEVILRGRIPMLIENVDLAQWSRDYLGLVRDQSDIRVRNGEYKTLLSFFSNCSQMRRS